MQSGPDENAVKVKEKQDQFLHLAMRHIGMPMSLIEPAIEMGLLLCDPQRGQSAWGRYIGIALNLSNGTQAARMDIDMSAKHDEHWWAQQLLLLRAAKEEAESGELSK